MINDVAGERIPLRTAGPLRGGLTAAGNPRSAGDAGNRDTRPAVVRVAVSREATFAGAARAGKEPPMATQHQVIDIRLPSGLILRDAVGLLCVKFGQWPWGRFDGISPADPNTIMDADVDISFSGARARSNVPRALYKARIQEKRDELTAFLRAIPADVG